ncbi:MAG: O-antigen ligase family protein [Patescibacteria group bacterium]
MFWIGIILILEFASLATVFVPVARTVMAITAGAIVAFVTLRRPTIGLALIALELAIGSKGALLKITEGAEVDGGISLRIIIFSCFMIAWLVNAIIYWKNNSKKLKPAITKILKGRWAWIALFLVCIWGFVRGLCLKNINLISDANAWIFLTLIIPVLDAARRDGENLINDVSRALVAAFLWLPVKTLLLLYVWSHGIASLSQPLYLWVRRTGVAEVTLVTGNLFRVFIQSQVYALFGFLFGLSYLSYRTDRINETNRTNKKLGYAILIGTAVSILISLSRSFWVGLAAGVVVFFILKLCHIERSRDIFKLANPILNFFVAIGAGILLIFSVVAFPLPRVDVGSLSTLFGSRGSTTDVAAESRWNLLPVLAEKIKQAPILGSGFGATVTYKSKDPRILAKDAEGLYTTYAFEWGWLEHWIKFGILGIPIMLWLVLSLAWRVNRSKTETWVKVGLISSLAALSALHVFTPYLNHPLGFGVLLSVEAMIEASKRT